jgi:predicted RNA-binding protein with RPS1 domain
MEETLIGKKVRARVSRIERYGMYLVYADSEILVLIPDVSIEPVRDIHDLYRVGDDVEVKIILYAATTGKFRGTLVETPVGSPIT